MMKFACGLKWDATYKGYISGDCQRMNIPVSENWFGCLFIVRSSHRGFRLLVLLYKNLFARKHCCVHVRSEELSLNKVEEHDDDSIHLMVTIIKNLKRKMEGQQSAINEKERTKQPKTPDEQVCRAQNRHPLNEHLPIELHLYTSPKRPINRKLNCIRRSIMERKEEPTKIFNSLLPTMPNDMGPVVLKNCILCIILSFLLIGVTPSSTATKVASSSPKRLANHVCRAGWCSDFVLRFQQVSSGRARLNWQELSLK